MTRRVSPSDASTRIADLVNPKTAVQPRRVIGPNQTVSQAKVELARANSGLELHPCLAVCDQNLRLSCLGVTVILPDTTQTRVATGEYHANFVQPRAA